jgi:hypothetical protein
MVSDKTLMIRDLEGNHLGLIVILSRHSSEGTEESHEKPQSEVRIKHLTNTSPRLQVSHVYEVCSSNIIKCTLSVEKDRLSLLQTHDNKAPA